MSGERQKQKESEELPFNSHWVPGKVCLDVYSFRFSAEPLRASAIPLQPETRMCAPGLSHLGDRKKGERISSPWNVKSRCEAISVSHWAAVRLLEKTHNLDVSSTISGETPRAMCRNTTGSKAASLAHRHPFVFPVAIGLRGE